MWKDYDNDVTHHAYTTTSTYIIKQSWGKKKSLIMWSRGKPQQNISRPRHKICTIEEHGGQKSIHLNYKTCIVEKHNEKTNHNPSSCYWSLENDNSVVTHTPHMHHKPTPKKKKKKNQGEQEKRYDLTMQNKRKP
jgi:hypothetical protein